jgi:hypothetical protein
MFALTRNVAVRRAASVRLMASKATSSSEAAAFISADQTITQNRIYHKTHYASLALVPIALAAHPSALSMPVDIALAIVLPLHAHVSLKIDSFGNSHFCDFFFAILTNLL